MLDLTFGFDWSYEMYPEDASYDSKKALVAVNATKTSNFVSKVEKSVARESETLPTSRPGVDTCRTSLCKLRRNGKNKKIKGENKMKIWEYLLALCSKEEETTEKLNQFLYAVYMMGIKDAHEHRADDPCGVMAELGIYDAAYICSSLQEFTGVPAYFDFVKKMKNLEEK